MRERMSAAQEGRLPTGGDNDKSKMGVESFNRFYDTEKGQMLREDDKSEFPELFDHQSSEDEQAEGLG